VRPDRTRESARRRLSQVRFTVVIAAFNAARTIRSTIRSVLAQTQQEFEVVVVDDGSTDNTAERARYFTTDPRIRVMTQRNQGPAAARNAGLAVARGEYFAMLDADDLWLPGYLQVMGGALDAAPEAAFAYTDAWVLDDATKRVRRRSAMSYQRPPQTVPDARTFFLLLVDRNFVYTSVTARRLVLEAVGGFDESLVGVEDWDLWLRIARGGGRPVRVPEILAIYRLTPDSLTADPLRHIRKVCEFYGRMAEDPATDAEVEAIARRKLAHFADLAYRLEHETLRWRIRRLAGAVKHKLLSRGTWLERPPEAVARTLAAVGEDLGGATVAAEAGAADGSSRSMGAAPRSRNVRRPR
jgi:glycosyltransferase involved in cell wall biosynthesis